MRDGVAAGLRVAPQARPVAAAGLHLTATGAEGVKARLHERDVLLALQVKRHGDAVNPHVAQLRAFVDPAQRTRSGVASQ